MFKKKPKEGAVFVCEDPDIGLEDFLINVGCEEYIQTFKTAGAKKVEDLVVLDNDDLKQMLPLIPYRKLKHSLEDFEKRHLRRRSKSFGGGGKKEAPSKAGPKTSTASSSSSLPVPEASSPEKTSTLRSVGSQGSGGGNEHTYINTQQQQNPVVAAASAASPLEEDQPEYEDPDKQPEDDNGDYEVPHEPGETVEIKPQPLPANPNLWSNADVLRWLKENNLGDFKDIIYANGFSGDQLLSVNIASFRKAFSEEQCETLGRAISTLRNSANGSSAQPAAAAAAPAAQAASAPKANASSGRYVNMNEGKMIKAVYSFSATTPKQLSITAGEILTVVDDSKNWWTVRNAAGNQGVVPSNYVEYHEYTNDSPIIGGPVSQEDPLERKIYFHGSITRQDAERLLAGKDWGTFLIRTSQSEPNCFTLSISGKSTNIIHLQIAKVDGKFALGKGAAAEYNSVEELVDLHKSSEIKVTGKESILLRFPCQKQ